MFVFSNKMPRNAIYPIEEEEYQMKFKNACPRLQKWKTRFEEADFDVNKLRNQAINKSPVYVAIQRGSKNIQIRTKTSTYLWRLWIQQGRRVNDEVRITFSHISVI